MDSGVLAAIADDELGYPLAPDVEAFRLANSALVRLKAWEASPRRCSTVLGSPAPLVAGRLRAPAHRGPACAAGVAELAPGPGADTAAFAARGLGA